MSHVHRVFACTAAGVFAAALTGFPAAHVAAQLSPQAPADAPRFEVDPQWPKPLPNNWIIGQVGGIAVDRNDNIWILQRPRSLTGDEAGATDATTEVCDDGFPPSAGGTCADGSDPVPSDPFGNPRPFGPIADCCVPAPSVLQFDPDGNLLQAWGGPEHRDPAWGWPAPNCTAPECEWPAGEHGIFVDHNDNVYIAGNGFGNGTLGSGLNGRGWDGQVLKFSADGTFLMQVGAAGSEMAESNDTGGGMNGTPQLWRPADTEVDPATNELYIADGYGNHRIVVVDADSGEYKRHWGAYGQKPVDDGLSDMAGAYGADPGPGIIPFFRNPVHCVRITRDDKVYVCDRVNDRIQVFDKHVAGTIETCSNLNGVGGQCGFVEEKFIRADTLGPGSVWDLDASTDRRQSCLYNADGTNQQVDTLFRPTLELLASFGRSGRRAGDFHWVHNLATDSFGNIYTAEVDTGKRAQKFERVGRPNCREPR